MGPRGLRRSKTWDLRRRRRGGRDREELATERDLSLSDRDTCRLRTQRPDRCACLLPARVCAVAKARTTCCSHGVRHFA
ncbi:hypothetical protein BDA96_03G345400 [Sorghum bicolor]|uniref:Uncharacterized protein n=2 Tax=Sorghum bicolor TaxID=4558 RepID=A0A921RH13_SORBI|nr:hypothetical protein BDA96_03G345400 [Sorghum bicolor]KXG33536.1 hypothetical protein SORBI_3003G320400 [Sorghum bicolor]